MTDSEVLFKDLDISVSLKLPNACREEVYAISSHSVLRLWIGSDRQCIELIGKAYPLDVTMTLCNQGYFSPYWLERLLTFVKVSIKFLVAIIRENIVINDFYIIL